MPQNETNKLTFKLQHITSLEEVKAFADYLINELHISIHPDDDFEDYCSFNTGEPLFSKEDASKYNRLMGECFIVSDKAGTDVYEVLPYLQKVVIEAYNPQNPS